MVRFLILGAAFLMTTCATPGPWNPTVPLPPGKSKIIILTFDDGLVQDRKLVELLNRYGLKGTFFLNSGHFGTEAPWTTPPSNYIDASEVAHLYEGHEVGGHTFTHPNLLDSSDQEILDEISLDKKALEELTGYPVVSFAYPFGLGDGNVARVLGQAGYHSGRLINHDRDKPLAITDPLLFVPSVHINQGAQALRSFLAPGNQEKVLIFWGHSWEFDQDPEFKWPQLEELLKSISSRQEIWSGTMKDIIP